MFLVVLLELDLPESLITLRIFVPRVFIELLDVDDCSLELARAKAFTELGVTFIHVS